MLQSQNSASIKELQDILSNKVATINIINDMFKGFKVCKELQKLNSFKAKGIKPIEVLSALLLIPYVLEKTIHSLVKSSVSLITDMEKDALYRLKNDSRINWRNLLYSIAMRYQKISNSKSIKADEPCNDIISNVKCLVIDDTILRKTGNKIESIGKVFDHVTNSYVLGFKMLCCCFWDGKSLNPIDFSIHSERGKKKRNKLYKPYGFTRKQLKKRFYKKREKSSPGFKRKKETTKSKITVMIEMVKRAIHKGLVPNYVLMDKWFISEKVLIAIRKINKSKVHVISACKKDKRKYEYHGKLYTAIELLKMNKERKKRCRGIKSFYIKVMVRYKGIPMILYFNKPTKRRKNWELLVTTNTKLSFINVMKIYRIRWGIEVFFKESKQYLLLGKCQSQDFDAQIADIALSMIRYILLNLYKRFRDYETLGEAFTNTRMFALKLNIGQRLWLIFLEIVMKLIEMFEMEEELFMKKLFSIPEFEELVYVFFDKSQLLQIE